MTPTLIIIIVLVVLALWIAGTYNGLVTLRNRVKESWSDIDVQLKRRYDLIPNLVETVKGYAKHETGVFENVTKARAAAMSLPPQAGAQEHAAVENMLTGALKSLFAVAEAYPDLKASNNFAKLQDELSDTENKIQAARRFYNSNVMSLNTRIEQFPSNIIAGMFSFKQSEFFEVEQEQEKQPVAVKF